MHTAHSKQLRMAFASINVDLYMRVCGMNSMDPVINEGYNASSKFNGRTHTKEGAYKDS